MKDATNPRALAPAAVFDLDGTLIPGSAERRVLARLLKSGEIGPAQLASTAARFLARLGSWKDMTIRNKRYLRGLSPARLTGAAEAAIPDAGALVFPWMRARMREHRGRGERLVLISGTLEPVVEIFARALGFDHCRGTRLVVRDGLLTGEIDGAHPYGPAKRILWEEMAASLGFDPARSFAYGDHHADRALLESVASPVAVCPDAGLLRLARARGWPVIDSQAFLPLR